MAKQLSDRQKEEIADGFSLYDTIGDGKVDSRLLGEILRALGQNPTNAEVAKVIKQLDPKGNRRVSMDEFLPVFQSMNAKTRPFGAEDFIESLKVFDNDCSGTISAAELRHVLTSIGEKLSDEEVDILFQTSEYNQGQINYEDFTRAVLNS